MNIVSRYITGYVRDRNDISRVRIISDHQNTSRTEFCQKATGYSIIIIDNSSGRREEGGREEGRRGVIFTACTQVGRKLLKGIWVAQCRLHSSSASPSSIAHSVSLNWCLCSSMRSFRLTGSSSCLPCPIGTTIFDGPAGFLVVTCTACENLSLVVVVCPVTIRVVLHVAPLAWVSEHHRVSRFRRRFPTSCRDRVPYTSGT